MTRKLEFVTNITQYEFLDLLGVPYGWRIVEGCLPALILDREVQMQSLRVNLEQGHFTLDDVETMDKAMKEAGLENLEAMFDKVRKFQIPANHSPFFRFEVCTTADCNQPLVHGGIFRGEDPVPDQNIGPVETLEYGLGICETLARLGKKLDTVRIFQQMLEAKLATNQREWQERYEALPPLFGD